MMRIQKILAMGGISSRREAEKIIMNKRVTVNGKLVTQLGVKADPYKDTIAVDGKPVKTNKTIYLMMNKPPGYLCTRKDPQNRPLIYDLLPEDYPYLFSVGRLDFNSEGLLILTNDGDFSHRMTHPSSSINRIYEVKIKGKLSEQQLKQFESGILLPDGMAKAHQASFMKKRIDKNIWIRLIISEGRYREIRRMCEKIGLIVLKIKRVSFGPVQLGQLEKGSVRKLASHEINSLKAMLYDI